MVGSLQYVLNYELVSNKRDSVYRKSIYKHYLIVKDTIESTIEKVDFDGNGINYIKFFYVLTANGVVSIILRRLWKFQKISCIVKF